MDKNELIDKLYKEAFQNKCKNFGYLKRLWLWITNRCAKCGAKLLLYDGIKKDLPVCEWCDQINPERVLQKNRTVDFRRRAPPVNPAVYKILFFLVILFAIWKIFEIRKQGEPIVFHWYSHPQ